MGCNAFSVDEFVGTVSQGSPECVRGNRWLMDLKTFGIGRTGTDGYWKLCSFGEHEKLTKPFEVYRRCSHRHVV